MLRIDQLISVDPNPGPSLKPFKKVSLEFSEISQQTSVPDETWFIEIRALTGATPRFELHVAYNNTGVAVDVDIVQDSYYGTVSNTLVRELLAAYEGELALFTTAAAGAVANNDFRIMLPAAIWDLSKLCPEFYQ